MKLVLFSLFVVISFHFIAQTGGTSSFQLLNLAYNARAAGLGNDFITVKDQDINLGISNPSLYNEKMIKQLSINQAFLAAGINYGQVAYGAKLKNGVLGSSIRYVNYGNFNRTDINGTSLGNFSPFECIIGLGYGKSLNPQLSIGGNLNLLYSQLESYSAFGTSIDLAGTFTDLKGQLLITALVKNAGMMLKNYQQNKRELLPTEFQVAASYKLKHAPFRFSLVCHHLNQWNITYVDPNLKPTVNLLTGDTIPVTYDGFGEKLARHFTYQTEILISKNIHIRMGFDYQRRQEMKLAQRSGLAGFSTGIGFYFKKISIDYGFSVFSKAGFNNLITLSSNIATWRK
jgi:hypothetical protein